MLEEPKIKKVDKRDKQLPQNFEQLIEMYDIEKIWPFILKTIQFINKEIPEDFKELIGKYELEDILKFFKSASKIMYFNASGKGMAIGKVSEKNAFEIGMPTEFLGDVNLGNNIVNNPTWNTTAQNNVDYNDMTKSGTYYMGTGCSNAPEGASYVRLFVSGYISQGDILQIAGTVTSSRLFVRTSANEVWGDWKALPNVEYLGTGKDLNNIKNVGQYGIYGTNTNCPTTSISVLEVVKYSADWILQRITTIEANPKIYERCYHSGNTWGAWLQTLNAGVPVSGTFNRGSWNIPTRGLITQVTDNSGGQHSVIVGLASDGTTRIYGMDFLDQDSWPVMRLYSGSSYLGISGDGIEFNGRYLQEKTVTAYANTSGTTGTVTLSVSAGNYNHIRITYKNSDGQYGSTTIGGVNNANCTTYGTIVRKNGDNSAILINSALFTVSGNTITISRNSQANMWFGDNDNASDNNALYITKVELWN